MLFSDWKVGTGLKTVMAEDNVCWLMGIKLQITESKFKTHINIQRPQLLSLYTLVPNSVQSKLNRFVFSTGCLLEEHFVMPLCKPLSTIYSHVVPSTLYYLRYMFSE